MGISSKIADLNYERNHNWSLPFTNKNARQSIYAFSGDVYRGLDAYSIDHEKIDFMQSTVRIISGLYGLVKPLDLIQPYRLEMGAKLSFDNNKNLYEYWREKNTTHTWEKIKGDPMSHGYYINEGVLEGLRVIATYCPDN